MDILSEIKITPACACLRQADLSAVPAQAGREDYKLPTNVQGENLNKTNITLNIMQSLPDVLSKYDYESLIEWYLTFKEFAAIGWKLQSAILTEAYFRVSTSILHGSKQQILKIIAQDFGIGVQRLYQKIQLWLNFWQDTNFTGKVVPNDRSWVFEQFQNGEAYFREALTSPDPISSITEAETKYLEAVKEGSTYTVKQFKIELSLTHKDENGRLQQISRKISDLAETADSLITEADESCVIIRDFSDNLKQISDKLMEHSLSKEEYDPFINQRERGLKKLKSLLELGIQQVQKLILEGLDEIESMENNLVSLWDQVENIIKKEENNKCL